MGLTWSRMAGRAFDFRRAWRGLADRESGSTPKSQFGHVDALVLSLAIDHLDVKCIVCQADDLRDRLDVALRATEPSNPARCIAAPAGVRHVRLLPVEQIGAGDDQDCAAALVFGLSPVLSLAAHGDGLAGKSLLLLNSRSAALWQCGLGILFDEVRRDAAEALARKIAESMRGEWIDPLALFETVQMLSAKLRAAGHLDTEQVPQDDSRIAQLEVEIAALKKAALVRQHLLLVEAAAQRHSVDA